jgi:hypothetical protein
LRQLAFAKARQHWTLEDWSKILFADETWNYKLFNGNIWETRTPEEEVGTLSQK